MGYSMVNLDGYNCFICEEGSKVSTLAGIDGYRQLVVMLEISNTCRACRK